MSAWTSEDVADILTFLASHEPLRGVENTEDMRDDIESGRFLILDACATALRAENARAQAARDADVEHMLGEPGGSAAAA